MITNERLYDLAKEVREQARNPEDVGPEERAFRKLAVRYRNGDDSILEPRASGTLRPILVSPIFGGYERVTAYVLSIQGSPPRGNFLVDASMGDNWVGDAMYWLGSFQAKKIRWGTKDWQIIKRYYKSLDLDS